MSLGYASRLSHKEDLGGQLGDPEIHDHAQTVQMRVHQLAEMVKQASKVIAFTGAGISTSCGIPDFRGPQGVWTLQKAGKELPILQTSFTYAKPSLTHQALLALEQNGKLTYICSQNVDGLHLRSGVPRQHLAELHGNCFAERCKKCKQEYVRDFEMETVGFKQTGRQCPKCGKPLFDQILDWEDALPKDDLKASEKHATEADLSICLGTSLQIYPAANLPLRTLKSGGHMAIINLQATPKDKKASIVIHAKVDEVMALLMHYLGIPVPTYIRTDYISISHAVKPPSTSAAQCSGQSSVPQQTAGSQKHWQHSVRNHNTSNNLTSNATATSLHPTADVDADSWCFTLTVSSTHGLSCPLPMVRSVEIAFPQHPELQPAGFDGPPPYQLTRSVSSSNDTLRVRVSLQLAEHADEHKRSAEFDYPFKRGSSSGSTSFSFVTQVQDYTSLQQELITKLHTTAASAPPLAVNGNEERGAAAAKPKQRQRRKWSQPDSQSYAETEIDTLADLDFAGPKGADLDGTGNGSSVDGRRSSSTGRATKRTKKLNL
eukprot:jgi/Chrzof1/14146/Cz08g26220.t1